MIKYINQSILNMAARCPIQVEFRYVKELKIPPGIAAIRGTAVDKAAQEDLKLKMETGKTLSVADLQDLTVQKFEEAYDREGCYMSAEDAQDIRTIKGAAKDDAVRAIAVYGDLIQPKIETPTHIQPELVYSFDGYDYPLGGTLDLIQVAAGKHRIVDFKTSGAKPAGNLATHSVQAPLYKMLAEQVLEIKTEFDYEYMVVQKSKAENVTVRALTNSQAEHNIFHRQRILEKILREGIFYPADPGHWVCSEKWCGYWGICKFGAKQSVQI